MNHPPKNEPLWSVSFSAWLAVQVTSIFLLQQDWLRKQGAWLLGFQQLQEVQNHSFQWTQVQINSFSFQASACVLLNGPDVTVHLRAQLGWMLFVGLQQQAAFPVVLRYHGNCHFINRQIATQDPKPSYCPELLKLYKSLETLGVALTLMCATAAPVTEKDFVPPSLKLLFHCQWSNSHREQITCRDTFG